MNIKFINNPFAQKTVAILIIFISTFIVFDGVLKGKQINNFAYLYAFEPWAKYWTPEVGNYNYILSDDMDAMSMSFPAAEHLANGEILYWNNSWQLGIPEFRISSGWFYPLRIFWALFGIPLGMTIEVLLRFILGGVFTYLLLELLGVHKILALTCSIGYIFGSNSIGDYMYGFGPPGLSLPMIFYFLERLIRFRKVRDLVFFSLSLIWLNTHIMVHVNAIISIWIAIYAVLRIISERFSAELIRKIGLAMLFAPLLFAFALIPTLDFYLYYFNDSYRQEYAAAQLRPGAMLSLFFNKFFGDPLTEPERYAHGTYINTGIFIGYLAGILGLVLSVFRLIFKPDRIIVILYIVTIPMLLTIFDFHYESAETFLGSMPLIKYIRPFYQKPILQFLLLLIGALGLEHFWRLTKNNRFQIINSIVAMIAIQAIGTYLFLWHYQNKGPSPILLRYFNIYTIVHFLLFFTLCISHPLFRNWLGQRKGNILFVLACFSLVGFTTIESRNASLTWVPYSRSSDFYTKTETTDYLFNNLGNSRVIALDRAAVPGLLFGKGVPIAAGRSLPREPYLELLRLAWPGLHKDHPTQSLFPLAETDLVHPIWDIANVNYFIAGKNIDLNLLNNKYGSKILLNSFSDGTIIERVNKSTGYAISSKVQHITNKDELIKEVNSGMDLKKEIIITDLNLPVGYDTNSLECNQPITVRDFKFSVNKITAIINNNCPAYFMPSVFIDRGWSAYVNGIEAKINVAYGFMPVIKIENSGEHKVEFKYFPSGLKLGGLISILGLLAFIALLYIETLICRKKVRT